MDKEKLRTEALHLRKILSVLATQSAEVDQLDNALADLLDRSIAGQIDQPLQRNEVPGRYLFDEKGLRRYEDLERAYAHFVFELTGGSNPTRDAIIAEIDRL